MNEFILPYIHFFTRKFVGTLGQLPYGGVISGMAYLIKDFDTCLLLYLGESIKMAPSIQFLNRVVRTCPPTV